VAKHGESVGAWLQGAAAGLSPEAEVALFERALTALWRRARLTLGELTLSAIVDRVLATATARHPLLAGVHMEGDRPSCDELRRGAAGLPHGLLREAIRGVLEDWLTVVGNLTGEILTPALHEALYHVTPTAPEGEEKP
jgi:hypothetical protein